MRPRSRNLCPEVWRLTNSSSEKQDEANNHDNHPRRSILLSAKSLPLLQLRLFKVPNINVGHQPQHIPRWCSLGCGLHPSPDQDGRAETSRNLSTEASLNHEIVLHPSHAFLNYLVTPTRLAITAPTPLARNNIPPGSSTLNIGTSWNSSVHSTSINACTTLLPCCHPLIKSKGFLSLPLAARPRGALAVTVDAQATFRSVGGGQDHPEHHPNINYLDQHQPQ